MASLRIPTIHTNGSSPEHLTEALDIAGRALYTALDALQETEPHARDYYLQGEEAFEEARAQHRSRLLRVQQVLEEVKEIREKLED